MRTTTNLLTGTNSEVFMGLQPLVFQQPQDWLRSSAYFLMGTSSVSLLFLEFCLPPLSKTTGACPPTARCLLYGCPSNSLRHTIHWESKSARVPSVSPFLYTVQPSILTPIVRSSTAQILITSSNPPVPSVTAVSPLTQFST